MSKTVYRVLWAIAGVLLIVAGILCMTREGTALASIAVFLGIVMLVSGVVDIVIFCAAGNMMFGSGWYLANGILTIIMAIFILCNQAFTMLTLPFIFGMWLMVTGISRFVNSFDLRRFGVRGWGWVTALGVLLTLGGFVSFVDPVAGAAAIGVLLGLCLIAEGAAAIVRACCADRFWR